MLFSGPVPATRPPFDPELAGELPGIRAVRPPVVDDAAIPLLRAGLPGTALTSDDPRFTVEQSGRLLIFRPPEPAGLLYFIHGGGFVAGDHRLGLADPLDWAAELSLVLVSVDYRLAPEHRHPVPVEDCYAGLVAAAALEPAPPRIVLAGVSAGGGLAAAVALLARDRGGPRLAGQLLIGPMLDERNDSRSARQMDGAGVWDRTANETGWRSLLGPDRRTGPVSPYASPAHATDLSGLPPAYIDVGSAETFRDEDVAYAGAIWAAGGEAELHVWPGGYHGFDTLVPGARISRSAKAARIDWLRRLLT
ncbi:alpha/beta hydrolase fold domain-containing protein [Actinoplanes sp. NPDC051411]|uniref:alpha/beta hydrolase fold domain-containing protein n=1 Tax=Actinoplanes sp. NPDC051411 TaxID=3155522 RepID=UPI00341379D6